MDKEQVITIAQSMGFVLDYDQWDVEGKEWLRFQFKGYDTTNMCLIWWKSEPLETVLKQSANILYRAGQEMKIKQINGVVNL
jgi:hypothetical protein